MVKQKERGVQVRDSEKAQRAAKVSISRIALSRAYHFGHPATQVNICDTRAHIYLDLRATNFQLRHLTPSTPQSGTTSSFPCRFFAQLLVASLHDVLRVRCEGSARCRG